MKKYLCPLCSKESAYISEYGLADSVICKCQGLKEVGRLINGVYQPSFSQVSPVASPVLTSMKIDSGFFLAGDFSVRQLKTDEEVKQTGHKFQNALSHDRVRADYMSKGTIWLAQHQDDAKSIVFFIDNQKQLQNFYLFKNATPPIEDKNLIVSALQKKGLIV